MKRIIYTTLVVLCGCWLWLNPNSSAQKGQTGDISPAKRTLAFEKTDWGTLIVSDAKGKIAANEGYVLVYQLLDGKSKKPKGEPKVVQAIGESYSKENAVCAPCQRKNVASLLTTDGALIINTSFIFRGNQVEVVRRIQNISREKDIVEFLAVRLQHDSQLDLGKPPLLGQAKPQAQKTSKVTSGWRGSSDTMMVQTWLPVRKPFELSCEFCPENCPPPLNLSVGESEIYCINCPKDGKSPVGWRMGSAASTFEDTCQHKLIVTGWGIGDDSRKSRYELVCVDCPDSVGDLYSATSIPRPSAISQSTQQTLNESSGCDLSIIVDRGSKPVKSLLAGGGAGILGSSSLGPGGQLVTSETLGQQ